MAAIDFVTNTAASFYGFKQDNFRMNNQSRDVLLTFVNTPQCNVISATAKSQSEISFETEITNVQSGSIIFYKNVIKPLVKEDVLQNIGIIYLPQAPVVSLYQCLQLVYSPLLLSQKGLDAQLQETLSQFEYGLRTLAQGKGNGQSLKVVMSITDELEYWTEIANSSKSNKHSDAAKAFIEILKQICEETGSLNTEPVADMADIMETIGGLLDDLWRHHTHIYPQERMTHLIDILGNVCITRLQKILSLLNVWSCEGFEKSNNIVEVLTDCVRVMDVWLNSSESLTELYWPNHALHRWIGAKHVQEHCHLFQERLLEVLQIRSVHSQLTKLLTLTEQQELNTKGMFESFQNLNVWICVTGLKGDWMNAVSQFESLLRPAEVKVAEKLKPRLSNLSTNQLLSELVRYSALIERPTIKKALHNELELLVDALQALLKDIEKQIDSGSEFGEDIRQAYDLSPTVKQIQWAKQMESRVKEILNVTEGLLKDFERHKELQTQAGNIKKALQGMYSQLFEDWTRDLQAELNAGTLQPSPDTPVLQFSPKTDMLHVTFNPRLVSLERQARQMTAMGMPPPPAVAEALDKATQFLQQARVLQQVASFHNTQGERMIVSQKPMMLKAAMKLASLVQDQKTVYWNDVEAISKYAASLKEAVNNLTSQNDYLTSQHIALRNIVLTLMDTDLLVKQNEWKKSVREIRDIIEKVESRGYVNTEGWRAHWDAQLYKALECQYRKTLIGIHRHFPVVKIELVFRGQKICLQPPIEELRVQHYNQLRRLVSVPMQFVCLSSTQPSSESIFKSIVEQYSWMANKAVKQIEMALSAAEAVAKAWSRRGALGFVDVNELCREHLDKPEHWEANFKACKALGQAVAKISFQDEKIEWLSMSTASLRRDFEAQVRSLWTALISSLQDSCQTDMSVIEEFIANALVTLDKTVVPKNSRDLADLSSSQNILKDKTPEIAAMVEGLKKKQAVLRAWGGDQSIDGTVREWERVNEIMLSRQQLFEHQAETVKLGLQAEWDNLNAAVEVWWSRWQQNKPKANLLTSTSYSEAKTYLQQLHESNEQWHKYSSEKEDILGECVKFNLTPEIPSFWNEAEKSFKEYKEIWTPFHDYEEAFSTIAKQEWIVFQKKLYVLDEFLTEYKAKLQPLTPVTLFLQQEIEKHMDVTPMLKYLRGNDFTDRHWSEILSLLEIKDKASDTLLLEDLLNVSANIKRNLNILQKISSAASSEYIIRSALNDLELWYAGARLTVVYHKSKTEEEIPIVKDYREILNKVEEQQSLISSVRGSSNDSHGDQLSLWEQRLRRVQSTLTNMAHVQRNSHRAPRRAAPVGIGVKL